MDTPPPLRAQLELSLYQVEIGAYSSLHIHEMTSPHWIVSHVLRGHVLTRTRGEEARVSRGGVMVHPPQVPFSELADGPGVHEYLMFDLTQSWQMELLRLHPVSLVVRLEDPIAFSHVYRRLRDVWLRPPAPERDLLVFALATELIGLLIHSWRAAGSPLRPTVAQTSQDRFFDLICTMNAHLDRKWTRDDLAARVFLHPGYFDRVFRKTYGVAPMQMLRELRLRRAQQWLETTDDALDAIAAGCGLGDAAAFSRAFRARYGLPPGQYRQSAKATKQSYVLP